jgi:RNA polymerase sigma-70 factor (ECF subfamily)
MAGCPTRGAAGAGQRSRILRWARSLNDRNSSKRLFDMAHAGDVARAIQRDLVVAAQRGDTASFEALVRRHVDRLYGAARLMLRDTDLAEDAVQQALIRSWRDIRSLRDPDRFEPWLQKLLVRACYDEARRRRRWLAEVPMLTTIEEAGAIEVGLGERDLIERAFRSLSPEHRTILVLHFYLDLTPADIAVRLDLPGGTARSRLHYALAALRAAVEAGERGGGLRMGSLA